MSAERHEELLEELLDLGPEGASEDAREKLGSDEAFAREFEQMKKLRRALDAGADLEREILAEAGGPPTAEEVQSVRDILAGEMGEGRVLAGPGSGSSPLRWIALAAGLLLAVFLVRHLTSPEPPDPRPDVLGAGLELIEPVGELTSLPARFRWEIDNDAAQTFRIEIYAGTDAELGPRVRGPFTVEGKEWVPTDEERSALPTEGVWMLSPLDGSGTLIDSALSSYSVSDS